MRRIDADELLKALKLKMDGWYKGRTIECYIGEAPTINPEECRPHGRWIEIVEPDDSFGEMEYHKCSVCGQLRWFETNYCPNCGAVMNGKENNNA